MRAQHRGRLARGALSRLSCVGSVTLTGGPLAIKVSSAKPGTAVQQEARVRGGVSPDVKGAPDLRRGRASGEVRREGARMSNDTWTAGDVGADLEVVTAKLVDAELPGFEAEFDPSEAELAGAFVEDAVSEADAKESAADLTERA